MVRSFFVGKFVEPVYRGKVRMYYFSLLIYKKVIMGKLSMSQMAELREKMAGLPKNNLVEQRRNMPEIFCFNVLSPTLEDDLKALIEIKYIFSDEEICWIFQQVVAHKLSEDIIIAMVRKNYEIYYWAMHDLAEAIIDGKVSEKLLCEMIDYFVMLVPSILGVLFQGMCEHKISPEFILKLCDKGYIIPFGCAVLVLRATVSGDLPLKYLLEMVKTKSFVLEDLESALVKSWIRGKLSLSLFEVMFQSGYRFRKRNWKLMFESGYVVLVRAYLKQFYPSLAETI